MNLKITGKTFECGEQVHLVSINGEHPEPMTSATLAQAKEPAIKKSESKSRIFINAQRTRTNSKTTSARVWNRLLDLAERKGVSVYLTNLVDLDIDGAVINYNGKRAILIESNVSKRRRNVFLAHELGHIKLHVDKLSLAPGLTYNPVIEREAEYFGRKLRRYLERSLSTSEPDDLPAA